MLVANFNLSSAQIQLLVTFRVDKDTRLVERHGFHDVDHHVGHMKKLCKEGYMEWFDVEKDEAGDVIALPGYRITAKGEMMLRVVEMEIRKTLEWFEGAAPPERVQPGRHDIVRGKATVDAKGKYRRKRA